MRKPYRTIDDVLNSPWTVAAPPVKTTDRVLRSTKLEDSIYKDLRAGEKTAKHADWAEGFAKNYTITRENALDIVQKETGLVFAQVLEHAGVYKRTPEGKEAFLRFLGSI